ncbi:MAG: hypothetical protein WCI71_17260 [Bacteroidota bacterium]
MKKLISIVVVIIAISLGTTVYGQDKPYKDGSVWTVSFIKSNANMSASYLKQLKSTWVAVHDEAVKQGLILSYKVLAGASSNPGDFDILLLAEYKNFASMEGQDEKWDAIYKKVVGSEEDQKKLSESRVSMRSIYGEKMFREINYKL